MRTLTIAFFTMISTAWTCWADSFPGPVTAHVLRVVDGDTLEIEAPIWPQQWVRTAVRIRGIDAPEIRGANCEAERRHGLAAKARVEALLGINDGLSRPSSPSPKSSWTSSADGTSPPSCCPPGNPLAPA